MLWFVSVPTVGAAFSAALLIAIAGFDVPLRSSASSQQKIKTAMYTVREYGLWCAMFALVGVYALALM
jgi:hypothetical protein